MDSYFKCRFRERIKLEVRTLRIRKNKRVDLFVKLFISISHEIR